MLLKPGESDAKLLGTIKIQDFPIIPAEGIDQNLRAPMIAALKQGLDPSQNSVVPVHLMCSLLHTIEVLQRDASVMMQILVKLHQKEKFSQDDIQSEDAHVKDILSVVAASSLGETLQEIAKEK